MRCPPIFDHLTRYGVRTIRKFHELSLMTLGSLVSQALNMAAGVAMPEVKTAEPSVGLLDKKQVSFETSIRPEDKVR